MPPRHVSDRLGLRRGLVATLVLLSWLVQTSGAQPAALPAAGSVGTGIGDAAHAWVVVPEPRGGGFLLLHLPPRTARGLPDGVGASPAGRGRVVQRLGAAPEAIASVGGRVYLAMPAGSGGSAVRRGVYSVLAEPAMVGDLWLYRPERRLAAEASLAGQGRLVGFVGTPAGPAALIDHSGRRPRESRVGGVGAARLELVVLVSGEWWRVRVPDAADGGEGGDRFTLAASEQGLAIVGFDGAGRASVWVAAMERAAFVDAERERRRRIEEAVVAIEAGGARIDRRRAAEIERETSAGEIAPAWRRLDVASEARIGPGSTWLVGSRLLGSRADGGDVEIVSASGASANTLASIVGAMGPDGAPPASFAAVAGAAGGRRAIVVLAPPGSPDAGRGSLIDAKLDLRLVEVSTDTGAVLYDGPMETGAPLGQQEVRALLIVVMGVSAVLLVWAIRGAGQERAIQLPEDAALAEPGDRLLAGLVDYLVACVATGWILGEGLWDVVTMQVLMGVQGPEAALVFLGVGVALGTLMEGLFGRTPGKVVFGVRVVAAVGRRRGTWTPPGLGRALGRNLFRWVLAPVALLELSRRDGRHAGDRLAGTAVAVEVEESDEEDAGGE